MADFRGGDDIRHKSAASVQLSEGERRMSSRIEERLRQRKSLFGVPEYDLARREAERDELAREIAAQRDRLRMLRATVLQQLQEQHRGTPRWPSGPKVVATLVDEDEWWAKNLGRKQKAA
jgi:hypothetical protein